MKANEIVIIEALRYELTHGIPLFTAELLWHIVKCSRFFMKSFNVNTYAYNVLCIYHNVATMISIPGDVHLILAINYSYLTTDC